MSCITPNFALSVNPRYIYLSDKGGTYFSWSRSTRCITVVVDKSRHEFKTEIEAWQFVYDNVTDLFGKLQRSDNLSWRAYALRAEMMLKLGEERFTDMVNAMHGELTFMFDQALRALAAVRLTKATPKVVRVAQSKGVSWLDVRSRVRLPFHPEPVLLSVRGLPSPVEDKTWSLRLRTPGASDLSVMEVQRRFEELVGTLGYHGITVKDVQNGTCFDL